MSYFEIKHIYKIWKVKRSSNFSFGIIPPWLVGSKCKQKLSVCLGHLHVNISLSRIVIQENVLKVK